MTINLSFQFNREPLNFVIKEREIYYTQRKLAGGMWIRCIPPPENLIKVIALSRNRIPGHFINMFKFTEEEIKEYNDARDEEALAQLIIKDAKTRGCIYVPQEKEKEMPDKIEEKIEDATKST